MKLAWPPEVKEKRHDLVSDMPLSYKKHLEHLDAATEWQAERAGKSEIDEESLVRGFITVIPRHLRDGIVEVLSQHNFDMLYFRPVFDEPQFLPKPNHGPANHSGVIT